MSVQGREDRHLQRRTRVVALTEFVVNGARICDPSVPQATAVPAPAGTLPGQAGAPSTRPVRAWWRRRRAQAHQPRSDGVDSGPARQESHHLTAWIQGPAGLAEHLAAPGSRHCGLSAVTPMRLSEPLTKARARSDRRRLWALARSRRRLNAWSISRRSASLPLARFNDDPAVQRGGACCPCGLRVAS